MTNQNQIDRSIKDDGETNPLEFIDGIFEDDKINKVRITVKKWFPEENIYKNCSYWEDEKVSVIQIGKTWGGGKYNIIVQHTENGSKQAKIINKTFTLIDWWDRVAAGEIDEHGNPPPEEEPDDQEQEPIDIGEQVQEGIQAAISGLTDKVSPILKMLIPLITAWFTSKMQGGTEQGNQLLKQNADLMKLMITNANSKGEEAMDNIKSGFEFASQLQGPEPPAEPQALDHIVALLKDFAPQILEAYKNKNPGVMAKINSPEMQALLTPENLPATWESLKQQMGFQGAKDFLTGIGKYNDTLK